jgi:hypothetical protein
MLRMVDMKPMIDQHTSKGRGAGTDILCVVVLFMVSLVTVTPAKAVRDNVGHRKLHTVYRCIYSLYVMQEENAIRKTVTMLAA